MIKNLAYMDKLSSVSIFQTKLNSSAWNSESDTTSTCNSCAVQLLCRFSVATAYCT